MSRWSKFGWLWRRYRGAEHRENGPPQRRRNRPLHVELLEERAYGQRRCGELAGPPSCRTLDGRFLFPWSIRRSRPILRAAPQEDIQPAARHDLVPPRASVGRRRSRQESAQAGALSIGEGSGIGHGCSAKDAPEIGTSPRLGTGSGAKGCPRQWDLGAEWELDPAAGPRLAQRSGTQWLQPPQQGPTRPWGPHSRGTLGLVALSRQAPEWESSPASVLFSAADRNRQRCGESLKRCFCNCRTQRPRGANFEGIRGAHGR